MTERFKSLEETKNWLQRSLQDTEVVCRSQCCIMLCDTLLALLVYALYCLFCWCI